MPIWIGHIIALITMMVWGTTFVSSKVLLMNGLTPDMIFFLRFVQAYVLLALFCHKRWKADTLWDELLFLCLGIFGGSLYFLTENTALVHSTASNVSILVDSCPLITALLVGAVYKAERLNAIQMAGSMMAFVGMILIVLNGQLILHLNPLGDMLALTAAVTWALYSLIMRSVSGRYDVFFITRKVFFYGLLTILPFILYSAEMPNMTVLTKPVVAGNLMYLGIVASTICFVVWNYSMKLIGTVKATNYVYIQGIISLLAAKIILNERITWMALLGASVLILGMVIVQKTGKGETH